MIGKLDNQKIFTFLVVAVLIYCVFNMGTPAKSNMMGLHFPQMLQKKKTAPVHVQSISGADVGDMDDEYAPANLEGTNIDLNIGCAMNAGVGLASSLLPREMASQEDFGQFAPDEILKGQNFLDPRSQVGYPETLGGTLRNANQQIRAEPPNPKQPYMWNNSTIVPDLMQRKICT
jgi:hypothetical protein